MFQNILWHFLAKFETKQVHAVNLYHGISLPYEYQTIRLHGYGRQNHQKSLQMFDKKSNYSHLCDCLLRYIYRLFYSLSFSSVVQILIFFKLELEMYWIHGYLLLELYWINQTSKLVYVRHIVEIKPKICFTKKKKSTDFTMSIVLFNYLKKRNKRC